MEKFVFDCLREISNAAQSIDKAVGKIIGWEFGSAQWGQQAPANHSESTVPTTYIDDEVQKVVSEPAIVGKTVAEIIEEVKKLIIELKIKGSVREHRDGLLKFTSSVFGCVYGRTKEEIEEKLKEKIKQCKNKPLKTKSPKSSSPLLSEYYKTEYVPYKHHQNLAESSLVSIDGLFHFIVKQKFDRRLVDYTSKSIENFLYSIPQTRKRQKMQGLLNNMFTRAVALGLLKTNPCTPIDKVRHKQEQGTAFTFEEQKEFFSRLLQSDELTYTQKCYFVFLYLTGARRTEALTVRIQDVDFKNKILSIRGTKTEGSDRQIPLMPLVEKLLCSLHPQKEFYFPINANMVDKYFRTVWEKGKGHKTHDLRHTFGTIQICTQKVDVKTVSLWMGHSTISTTVNIYTHPEQLDRGTFFRGDITTEEKNAIYQERYGEILSIINGFVKQI